MTPNRHNNIGPIHSHRSHGQFNYSRNTNISRWKQSYVGETKVQSKSENDNVRRVATKSSRNSRRKYDFLQKFSVPFSTYLSVFLPTAVSLLPISVPVHPCTDNSKYPIASLPGKQFTGDKMFTS